MWLAHENYADYKDFLAQANLICFNLVNVWYDSLFKNDKAWEEDLFFHKYALLQSSIKFSIFKGTKRKGHCISNVPKKTIIGVT